MKTIQQDLKSNNLSLNETIVVAQNRPHWRLMSIYVWRYALLVVHTTKEEKEDTTQSVPICACMEFQVISLKLESEQHKEIAFFIITWIRN